MLQRILKQSNFSYLASNQWIRLVILTLSIGLVACGQETTPAKPPVPAVSVYEIKSQSVGGYREFVARTQAFKEADLRARVEGELIERHFKEGSNVEKGQTLFQIDPAAYKAAVSSAKADLSSRLSGESQAKQNLKRANDLIDDGYISQSDFDRLTTEESQAVSAVKAAEAALENAKLNLSYTTITAPFTGRIGKVNFNVGNIVGPASNTLASLIVTDPIFVSFQVEESVFISYQQAHQGSNKSDAVEFDISLRLPNNSEYLEQGKLDFANTKISEGMGTVELRTVFPNPNNIILPGLFVTLMVESKDKQEMALIPQAAVQENQQGKFILIVDEDNKVIQRHVVLGRRINAMWVVESGVSVGENVIVEGLQKVRSGIEVKAIEKYVDPLVGTISDVDNQVNDSVKVNNSDNSATTSTVK
ncbi:efflux RND transporter periplasmic adaptor subunit [Colwellia sp. E2M01]|uniref:efflux RND transporter periplasmic adaptor subunit n=1 Tax=Colwellia sp. E2M01 TaxID=2841561 RepID=UPI001C0A0941|nr:efflux RND transporter periplasmic adaptor subunit [Colwellia sp. E2M01]MBU2869918.1 efflux RND transporter periplasmic adaptor subunit [Colwellia sp. E2M01]